MHTIIERSQRFLDRPLNVGPRVVLLGAALLLIPTHLPPLRGMAGRADLSWIPFAFGVLALLFLRAAVHGKVRDLTDVTVLTLYFVVFMIWTSTPIADFYGLVIVALFVVVAFGMGRNQAHSEDIAETRSAG